MPCSLFWLIPQIFLLIHLTLAQFSFFVQFPIVRDAKDQPHVDCSSKDYTKTPPVEYLPKTGTDPQTGNFLGSCRACTAENYCVNQFRIKAVAFDAFSGLTTDITTCDPVDVNGNTVALSDNVYSIVLQTKAPSFSAQQGNQIRDLGGTVKCNRGIWLVQYTTTIAGQYQLAVNLVTGTPGTSRYKLTPLQGIETYMLGSDLVQSTTASPFEGPATLIMPGEPTNSYFVDTVVSFRIPCNSNNVGYPACSYCLNQEINGGCPGNDQIPQAMRASKLVVQAADQFSNSATDYCANDQRMVPAMATLKIQTFGLTSCSKGVCSNATYAPMQTQFALQPQVPVRCVCDPADTCPAQQSPYTVYFTASYSGFYRLSITGAGVPVGPIVVPVVAGAVSAQQTVAYGPGLAEAFATQRTEFYIQPRDAFGNYHSSGVHVFQVSVSGASPYYQQSIVPTDSGRGFSMVSLILESPQVYSIDVRFCPDLIKYPPYSASDNRVCDLGAANGEGQRIAGSPFAKNVRDPFFVLTGADLPLIVPFFGQAQAGSAFFAIFTHISQQFRTCGETYGNPPIGVRYQPIIRLDIQGMTYTSSVPGPVLTTADVSLADVTEGRLAKTRYATFAGACLLNGYVMGFLLTVSGTYKVWIYTDSKSYRLVTGSVPELIVAPRPAVLANYRGLGPGLTCATETDCMANLLTKFVVQSRDQYMNNAISCSEVISVYVSPQLSGADHFVVTNLVAERNVGGVPINGAPGKGIDINTLSGSVGIPILPFNGTTTGCNLGTYSINLFATLSARYLVSITVNGSALYGSPFPIQIVDQILSLQPGAAVVGLVTQTRWTFYQAYFDFSNVGFVVDVSKADSKINQGQPWTFLRFQELWSDLQEPPSGVRFTYPDVRSSLYCEICRIHVPPTEGKAGFWYIAVYGFQDNSYFSVQLTPSPDKLLLSDIDNAQVGKIGAGHYAYYRFNIQSVYGFQVRAAIQNNNGGALTATLKKDDYPASDTDAGSVFGVSLRSAECTECIIDFPPSPDAPGKWYLSILGITQQVSFQVILIEHEQTVITFGKQYYEFTQLSYSWGYYTFVLDQYTDPDAIQVQVIPDDAKADLTTVLKQSQAPVSLSDSTFRTEQCTHCRFTVLTRSNLQSSWYVGVYTGASGATFRLRVRLYQSCPNQCFGNGECVQSKIKACVCFPGYTGIDCRSAVKSKMFAWFPLDVDAVDVSGNGIPLFYKLNTGGQLLFVDGAVSLFNTYIVLPKPTPAVACSQFLSPKPVSEKNFQWGSEIQVHEGSSANNEVDMVIPEVEEWYKWNEIGAKVGNPYSNLTCAEYNPRRELTVMFNLKFGLPLPSPGSFIGLGTASTIVGRPDVDQQGKWSWMIYPRYHPNGVNILVDLLLRNDSHEFSVREREVWPIDGRDLFLEKGTPRLRKFPAWCIDGMLTKSDGTCEYMAADKWYRITAVFGPRRAELWVGPTKVANMSLDLWNLTDVSGGRIHLGHDPRYAFYERLFFGQINDVRIMRYAASAIEISTIAQLGQSWFDFRRSQRQATGAETNDLGSWEYPLPLSTLDDGSLEQDVEPHADICRQYRNPNEPRSYLVAANCPFEDTSTSWILKNEIHLGYRKYSTDRTPYGLGFEIFVLKDTRPMPPIYLGQYYDYSIDPD